MTRLGSRSFGRPTLTLIENTEPIILCRDSEFGLRRGSELEAFREYYLKGYLILKFPASQLVTILSKLRNPEKVDAGSKALDKILDHDIRVHASGQGSPARKRQKKGR